MFNLGNQLLWEDEAETAVLGLNILKYGVPKAFDGKNLISQEWGNEFGDDYLWRWTPWLDKYIAALSFKIFGKSTAAARAPFAVLGVVSVVMAFFLARRIFQNSQIACLSVALLVVNVPFLLFCRQCRYYSPLILGTILTVYFFYGIMRSGRFSVIGFIVSTAIVIQSNMFSFFSVLGSLAAAYVCVPENRRTSRKVVIAYIAAFTAGGPVLLANLIFGKSAHIERLYTYWDNLKNCFADVHYFMFSFLLLGLFILGLLFCKKVADDARPHAGPMSFILIFCFSYVVLSALLPWHFFRYMVNMIPFYCILTAAIIYLLVRSRVLWIYAGILIVVSAHMYHPNELWPRKQRYIREKLCNMFPKFVKEITGDYKGPLKAVITYLDKHAGDDETIFVSYGAPVVQFYTNLTVIGGQDGRDLPAAMYPDWLLIRNFYFIDRPVARRYLEKNSAIIDKWINSGAYKNIEFPDVGDVYWENTPDPYFHLFASPGPRVVSGTVKLGKKR